jgi:ATP-dependent 26S proteasome regulatory subunit
LKNIVVDPNIEWSSIYQKSEFYSGADIANVVKEASFLPIRRMIMAKGGVKNANAEL